MWSLFNRSLVLLATALLALSAPAAALGMPAAPQGAEDAPPTETSLISGVMNEREVITDPEADTELQFAGGDPTAPADKDAPIDIVSVKIAETDRDFLVSIKHRGYPANEATLSTAAPMDAYCFLGFNVNGESAVTYRISMSYLHIFGNGYDGFADLSVREEEPDEDDPEEFFVDTEYLAGLWMALVGNDHYEVVVPKDLIQAAQRERALKTGDELRDFTIQCTRNSGTFFLRYSDSAEGQGAAGRYPVTLATSTQEIALGLPEDASPYLGVPVGETSKISITLKNLLDRKLLVNLTAQMVDADGKPLTGWTVKSAPTIEAKGNATMLASVVVTATSNVGHREGGILKVVAVPLGFDDRATFTMNLFATVPPTPEKNVLHFHRAPSWGFYCYGICITPGMLEGVADPNPDVFVMNILEQDPLYPDTPGEDDGIALFSTDYAYAYLDTPLGAPIRFDPDGFVDFTFALKTAVPREVVFDVDIWTLGDQYLTGNSRTISLTDTFQTFTFSMPLSGEVTDLPPGAFIGMSMSFREPVGFFFGNDAWVSSIEWDPDQSTLALPLVAVPQPKVNVTDGRALPSIALGNRTDKEEYVNPGKTQAFDLVLLNEGTQSDTLRLTTETSTPGWKIEFSPGNRFQLNPGASAPLCMTVTAPEDAVEKDRVNITLTATSKLDENVRTEIDLVLLVTTGVPIEPRSCADISEEDFVKPVTDEEESPAAPALFVVALFGLVLAAARRRRP